MKTLLTVTAIALSLVGCYTTGPSRKAQMVKEADEKMIHNCQYLGEVYGTDQWGVQLTRNSKIEYSKSMAREQAAELGATHVVWTKLSTGLIPSATGRAYRCK